MVMRKKLSILFALAMMLTMLVGCGGNTDVGNTDAGNTNTENRNDENDTVDISNLEGIYWLCTIGEVKKGFYMDGNGKYIDVYATAEFSLVEEYTIGSVQLVEETPDSEQESQKPAPEPEKPNWSKPFMGKYFVLPKWDNGEIVGYDN